MVEQLVDHQLITTPANFYTLEASDLASIERTGDLSISNLLKGIEASTSRPSLKSCLDWVFVMSERRPLKHLLKHIPI